MKESTRPSSETRRLLAATLPILAGFALTLVWVTRLSEEQAYAFSTGQAGEKVLEFNRHVRPILSENCFRCHGPDKNTRQANLRLDVRELALADRQGTRAIVPGNSAQSELVRRVTHPDPVVRMPPPESERSLTPEQIDILKRWIDLGAEYQPHWSYINPTRPKMPDTKDVQWPENAIDHFVLTNLERVGLRPSPQADPLTLIRRLSFDLTGLPPKPEQVDAFVKNHSRQAYEDLVDELLNSPHYGERMAMYWLDLVRYADSVGYHGDQSNISVSPYRDYIIRAFNTNMSFDQLTIEQLAGDLLPDATTEQKIASGYHRLGMMTAEGGAQAKEYLAKYAADRVRNASTVWMGATLGCAECHDHKFDPFTARDFYRFTAFFADLKEKGYYEGAHETGDWGPKIILPTKEQSAQMKRIDSEIAMLQKTLDTPTEQLAAGQVEWEKQVGELPPPPHFGQWYKIGPFWAESFDAAFSTSFEPEKEIDLSKTYQNGELKWTIQSDWVDGKTHRVRNNDGVVYLYRTVNSDVSRESNLSLGSDDGIQVWLNGNAVFDKKVQRRVAPDQDRVTVQLQPGENHLLIKIVNATDVSGFYFEALVPTEKIAAILKVPSQERTSEQKAELATYYLKIAPDLDRVREQLKVAREKKYQLLKEIPSTLVSIAVEPREMRILPRGNWMDESGEIVTPGVPHFLPQPSVSGRRLNRLDLARWLVSRNNPLTARVFVNRLWKLFFGTGLSRVVDDLGSRGEWPKHPELLDWLAVEFMDSGWDIKHLVKLLVMSSTYRQSSKPHDRLKEIDLDNRLLARQSRFRLDAEVIRDNALAVSGLLVPRIGGRSVKPYQPGGYWAQLNFPRRAYQSDHGEDQYRRGLYTHWQRTFLHPSLKAFDAPSREECTAERTVSNTPLQALVLLNDPTYVEAARVFAVRICGEGGSSFTGRLEWAYRRALSRRPTEKERAIFANLYRKHLDDYKLDVGFARRLFSVGNWPAPSGVHLSELAAWTSLSRVILNLHEMITRY